MYLLIVNFRINLLFISKTNLKRNNIILTTKKGKILKIKINKIICILKLG